MKKRVITGSVIFIVTLGFVLLKQVSALFFDAFALAILFGAIYEVINLYKSQGNRPTHVILYLSAVLLCIVNIFAKSIATMLALSLLVALVSLLASLTQEIIIFAIKRKNGTSETNIEILNKSLFDKTKTNMQIFAYPVLPISFLFAINHLPYEVGYIAIVLVFAISMLTDTMAYFTGRLIGRNKFIPEVSPKKTIEGVFGGLVGGIIGAIVCYFVFYYTNWFELLNLAGKLKSVFGFLLLGVVGSYVNQLGDLVASAQKRKANIKDYSNIFPGHGGFMDRVDGLMFTSVFVYLMMILLFV